MATQYFPKVTAADHEVFQRIVRHYPGRPYAEWQELQAKKIADWASRRSEIVMVDITPDEFTAHCERTGARPDISTFTAIIVAKGSR